MIRENFRNQLDLFDLDNMKIYNLNGTNNVIDLILRSI